MKIKTRILYMALQDEIGAYRASSFINKLKDLKKADSAPMILLKTIIDRGWKPELITYYLGSGSIFEKDFVEEVEAYLTKADIDFKVSN